MLSGVSIVCFAASYTVALALEVTRLLFRSGIRGAAMLGFAGAGLFAHTVFLCHRAIDASGSPLCGEQDWYLVTAWAIAAVYLYLTYFHPQTPFGLFLLPMVLGLVGAAAFLADPEPFAREPASRVWGIIHGTSILLATVAVLIGFAAGLMYLRQSHRLKHKQLPQGGLRLPSLEWLQRCSHRAIVIAMFTLSVGVLSGVVLNRINHAERLPWHDPLVLGTVTMLGWLVVSASIGFLYKPARDGRKMAYLTLANFLFLVAALAVGLLVETQHGGPRSEGMSVPSPPSAPGRPA